MALRRNKPRCRQAYVATVEGEERGVPFRVFFKRVDAAEECAIETGGVLQDLNTLRRVRYVAGEWRKA